MTELSEAPPSQRKNGALFLVALLLLTGIGFGLSLDASSAAMKELDPAKVRIGLGIFACIAFLWLTEPCHWPSPRCWFRCWAAASA